MKSLLDDYLPLKQAAHLLGMGVPTVRRKIREIKKGALPKSELPPFCEYLGRYYFPPEPAVRWFRRKIES